MSESVSFNIGEGFAREGDFYVPTFKTFNEIRIKPHNGKMMIYLVIKNVFDMIKTCIIDGEFFDLLASRFSTIKDIVVWVDHNYRYISVPEYCSMRCVATRATEFTYNGVRHIASVWNNCCKECRDNNLLLRMEKPFNLDITKRSIEIKREPFQTFEAMRGNYLVSVGSMSITVREPGCEFLFVPCDVGRLLVGLDAETIVDIVMEVGCYNNILPWVTHTASECQCEECCSEEMVRRVEEVLARTREY
jgi:hypothetical protein